MTAATMQLAEDLAQRIRGALPSDYEQRALLHYLIGYMAGDPELARAVDTYLELVARTPAGVTS